MLLRLFSIFIFSFTVNAAFEPTECVRNSDCEALIHKTCVPLISENRSVCMSLGSFEFCRKNDDCPSISASKCVEERGSSLEFNGSNEADTTFGICGAGNVSTEQNPFGLVMCRIIATATGQLGKGVSAVVVIVLGGMFFLGKLPWTTLIATVVGMGGIFGAKSVVKMLTGETLTCF